MKKSLLTLMLAAGAFTGAYADSQAAFPGGDAAMKEYISTNLKYPAMAKENGIEGVVDVSFTVKANGTIGGIKIVRMVDPDLEQEAIRLVKGMPAWTPATKGDTAVDSTVTLPVSFSLD